MPKISNFTKTDFYFSLMKQLGRSKLDFSSRNSGSFYCVVWHHWRALPFLLKLGQHCINVNSLWRGEKKKKTKSKLSCFFFTNSAWKIHILVLLRGPLAQISPCDQEINVGRGGENTREYHLAASGTMGNLQIWWNPLGKLNNPTNCICPKIHLC